MCHSYIHVHEGNTTMYTHMYILYIHMCVCASLCVFRNVSVCVRAFCIYTSYVWLMCITPLSCSRALSPSLSLSLYIYIYVYVYIYRERKRHSGSLDHSHTPTTSDRRTPTAKRRSTRQRRDFCVQRPLSSNYVVIEIHKHVDEPQSKLMSGDHIRLAQDLS